MSKVHSVRDYLYVNVLRYSLCIQLRDMFVECVCVCVCVCVCMCVCVTVCVNCIVPAAVVFRPQKIPQKETNACIIIRRCQPSSL